MVRKCELSKGTKNGHCIAMAETAKYLGCLPDGAAYLKRCSDKMMSAYSSPDASLEGSVSWCVAKYEALTQPRGLRWDQFPPADKSRYESSFCNEIGVHRQVLPCSSIWGFDLFSAWTNRSHLLQYIKGTSRVVCSDANPQRSQFCWKRRIAMDFSKSNSQAPRRKFFADFVQTFGQRVNLNKYQYETLLPISHQTGSRWPSECDVTEKRPVFVVSQGTVHR